MSAILMPEKGKISDWPWLICRSVYPMNYGTNNGFMDVVQNLWDIDIYINTGFIH